MNQTVAQIAQHYVHGNDIPEPMLNRIEHGIRCYDPVLELFDARRRPDAVAGAARRAGRHRAQRSGARINPACLRTRSSTNRSRRPLRNLQPPLARQKRFGING